MLKGNGTEGRTRTDTMSPPPDFESGASTSFATPAKNEKYIRVAKLVNHNNEINKLKKDYILNVS